MKTCGTVPILKRHRSVHPGSGPGQQFPWPTLPFGPFPEGMARLPREKTYGLTAQIRRAASSIPSNIAEGCGRDGDAELARFCIIARGSATELEYQLLLARDLKLLQADDYEELSIQTVEVKRMLTVLVQKLTAER